MNATTEYPRNFQGAYPACHALLKTDGKTYEVIQPYACSKKRFPLKTYDEVEVG